MAVGLSTKDRGSDEGPRSAQRSCRSATRKNVALLPDNLPVDRQEPLPVSIYVADGRPAGKGARRLNRQVSFSKNATMARSTGGGEGRDGRLGAGGEASDPRTGGSHHPEGARRKVGLNQPGLDRPNGRLGAVGNRDLAKNVLHMLLDRFDADRQRSPASRSSWPRTTTVCCSPRTI